MRLKIFSTCLLLFAATSCDKMETDTLFCNLTLSASLPDGAAIVRMEVDKSLESTYIRNFNNRMEYDFPVFVNNKGTLRVQKGVYLISFDAKATLQDGSIVSVRSSEHSNAERAVTLLGEREEITLNLTLLDLASGK